MPNINLIYYLIAGAIFGTLALKTGIPAAPLAGALIGASILSISGKIDVAQWPIGTRTILEIGIGTVIGTSLTKDSLVDLQSLWRPAILITFTLVITGLRASPHIAHAHFDLTFSWISELKPKKAYLTHLSPDSDHDNVLSLCPSNVAPAYDNMSFSI